MEYYIYQGSLAIIQRFFMSSVIVCSIMIFFTFNVKKRKSTPSLNLHLSHIKNTINTVVLIHLTNELSAHIQLLLKLMHTGFCCNFNCKNCFFAICKTIKLVELHQVYSTVYATVVVTPSFISAGSQQPNIQSRHNNMLKLNLVYNIGTTNASTIPDWIMTSQRQNFLKHELVSLDYEK